MILAVVAAALMSAAPEAADGKALFQAGQKLYKAAKFAEAVTKFEAAYEARPHPVIFFNIGKCYEQLGDTPKALRAYRDYLRLLPDATDKDTVKDSVANLERKLKEKGLQQVLIFLEPATARLTVDGKPLAGAPASIELTVGPHKLAAQADGFEPVERTFTVIAGRSAELTVNLEPKTAQTPAITKPVAESKPETKATDAPKTDTKTATLTPEARPNNAIDLKQAKPERKPRVLTWVAAGTALAAIGAGVGMTVVSSSADAQLRQADNTRTREQATALKGTKDGTATGAGIAFGVGGAAAIAAVVLFFIEGT